MKLKRYICYSVVVILCALSLTLGYINKSYAFGISKNVSGNVGSRVVNYIDTETKSVISWNDANTYYGVPMYDKASSNGVTVYFYKGKEISNNEYTKGSSIEDADERASRYGKSAYRVRTTAEFKNALDNIYQNLRIGKFHIVFSKYENINLTEVKNYYLSKYSVSNVKQNYYPYSVKGMWEPIRFQIDWTKISNEEEMLVDSSNIRITGNDRVVAEKFVDSILPYLYQNGTDYQKVLAAYSYLTTKYSYYTYSTDSEYFTDAPTSIYHAFINRKTDCIGWSIAFSLLMDKMGVESYIVDNVTYADEASGSFESTHTYNIVKLDGKFYKLDITGKVFLAGLSSTTLYDSRLNISTDKYRGTTNSVTIDYNKIDTLLATAKTTKTTTTSKIQDTTTTKYYSYSIPNGSSSVNKTTVKDEKTTTNSTVEGGTTTTKSDETYPWEEETSTYTGKFRTETTTKSGLFPTKKDNDDNEKKGFNLNLILIPLLVIGVGVLITIRIVNIKKNKNNLQPPFQQ